MADQLLLMFLGVMVAQFLYMCILWIQYRRKEFAYYVLHYIILFYFMVGVSYSYFFPLEIRESYQWVFRLFEFYPLHIFNFYLYIKFAQQFLDAEKNHPGLNRQAVFLMRGIWTSLAFIMVSWIYYFNNPGTFITIYLVVYILLKLWAVWVLYVVYRQRTWQTRVIFWATVFLSGGLICMYSLIMLVNIGVIPRTPWIFVPCIVGVLGEIYVINIGLNRKADEQRKGLLLFQGKWIDQLQRNKILLLNQSGLRKKLALQVNKEVGVTLNAMSLYADHSLNQLTLHKNGHLLPYLNRMLQDSKNMVESMSDIVWLLSTSNDSLEQVFFRLQYRGTKMLQDTGGSFRLIYPDEMPLKEMNMEIRRFIYTDFKSIMNSFHTLPDLQVEVAATTQENQLQLIWRINYSGPACSLSDLINDSAYNCTVDCMQAGAGDRFCFSSSWEWNSIQELMHQ